MKVLLSWSSGKDCAWTLHVLRRRGVEVVGLLTTFDGATDRVAMHGVRRALVERQAAAAGLPLVAVDLPWPCPNEAYERLVGAALGRARDEGTTHVAFGDLFLEDIRRWREAQLAPLGLAPLFPLWCAPDATGRLARDMLDGGLRAVVAAVDLRALAPGFAGREFDRRLLAELPPGVDPCGERGELHTFCWAGPMFREELRVEVGARTERDGFAFADPVPAPERREEPRRSSPPLDRIAAGAAQRG